ncbi:MAG: sigma-54 dependent transcriptional regulator [Deltaproteobacteria bacterium]
MEPNSQPLTSEQLRFLAFMSIADAPVHIDAAASIIAIKPTSLLNLMTKGLQSGYFLQTQKNVYLLSKDLPVELLSNIKGVVVPEFFTSVLESIEKNHLAEQLPPESMAGILEGAGRLYEAADIYHETATKESANGKFDSALKHEISAINVLKREKASRNRDTLFVSTVLSLSSIYICVSQAQSEIIALLRTAKELAVKMGDRRSSVMIDFHLGRYYFMLNQLSDTIDALHTAVEELDQFDDPDIRERAGQFVGLYYYIQGMYGKAASHLKKALRSTVSAYVAPFDYILLVYFAYSCVCSGQIHKAIGILDAHWRRAFKRSEFQHAYHIRAVLGVILLMTGRTKDALAHLNASRAYEWKDFNSIGKWISEAGLAAEAFHSGRVKESYAMLKHFFSERGQIRQYPIPFFLEMIAEYNRRKYQPIVGYAFEEESNRILQGPNIHIKGVLFRIMAQDAALSSPQKPSILKHLKESEKYLLEAGDPVELAKTYVEYARYYLNHEDKEKASEYSMKAWENFSGLGELLFPSDIRHLFTYDPKDESGLQDRSNLTERLIKMVADIIPAYDEPDLFERIFGAISGFLEADRAGLFLFKGRKENDLILRVSHSLVLDEIYTKEFRNSLSIIFMARTEEKPVVKTYSSEDKMALSIMCIPVNVGPDFDAVMFFESGYDDSGFARFGPDVPELLMNMAKDAFAKIMRYEKIKRAIKRTPDVIIPQAHNGEDHEIIASSPIMTGLLTQVDRAALTDASMLITGETGTGKELVAARIHRVSKRRNEPLVTVNIAGIPESLIESELFGYEKGAFTGADNQHKGRIELAHKGTLFIDELGEIPLPVQVKLLRVLQERSFSRLGGMISIKSDFRLISATNKDLEVEVAEGRFRRDLFYRVNAFRVHLPPLRERKTDIVLIARNLLKHFIKEFGKPDLEFTPEQVQALMEYPWPGNVRELRNVLERSTLLSDGGFVELALPSHKDTQQGNGYSDMPTLAEMERRYIKKVIRMMDGRISGKNGACEILGMKRTTLNGRMKKLGIKP